MKNLFIQSNKTIKDALKQLNKVGEKCLVVVNNDEKYLGTLSDGDLRKSILKGENLKDTIENIYNMQSTFLIEGKYTNKKIKKIFLKYKFDLIPIINSSREIVKILFWEKVFGNGKDLRGESLSVPVVIMAGGRGARLEPFTKVLPKPLIPIHDKPIIEHIIERFIHLGCFDFYLTVNYKGKILKAYFEELKPDYNVKFIEEKEPLGTAGSLRYLDGQLDRPFFVTNCDIIIKANYASIYEFHQEGNYDVTLVASAKEYVIPYGTCELNDEGHLSHINEKPGYDFLINTGLYMLNPGVLELIPKNTLYHITDLIKDAKDKGMKVGVFPIDDDAWVDVGQWTEYQKAIKKL